MRACISKPGSKINQSPTTSDLKKALKDSDSLIWLDLCDESVSSSQKVLSEIFHFHPLSIDDALVETHNPKIDEWDNYLYLALAGVNPDQPLEELDKSIELDIFLGRNYLVSYHPERIQAIDKVWVNIFRDERQVQRGSNYLLYQIIDELANEYMAMIDQLDMKVERIEDILLEKPDNLILQEIFIIKRSLLNLRRIVAPQREVLNKLSRGDYAVVNMNERMYYRDVYDHLVRIHDITESLRDLVSSALDMYLSVVNNRLNDIMKTLTLITTLFMPLSFLTGFFGMNFFFAGPDFGSWTSPSAFFAALSIIVSLPLFMFLWMRKREWM